MKVIKRTLLQDEYCGIKNDARYYDLSAFYNKINEKS